MYDVQTLREKVIAALEHELQASASGYPGAFPDIVTYIRAEMLERNPSYLFTLAELLNIKMV